MDSSFLLGKVSQSPTIPLGTSKSKEFDVADLYRSAGDRSASEDAAYGLDEKLRKAYFWITNYAIVTPFYDLEYDTTPAPEFVVGDLKTRVRFPTGQSYSSFVLLPLLNLIVQKRCLLVGGPGRGKTASAVLMALLAGYDNKEVKRAIQHGQPQMTVSDLLGNPIPSDLMTSKSFDEIKIAWRKWLGMTVKIIDEYNRIPTRTQSALLTVLADNYAEILDQIYECPDAAWYLTANDDAGGGTYQVIEALRDRIDIVVPAFHFNTRFVKELLRRVERAAKPEDALPPEIVFTNDEIAAMNRRIRQIAIPPELLRRIEYFAAQFELCESAAVQVEYKTKDNVKLSGVDFSTLAGSETGKDKSQDLGDQTRNGFSVRALMTTLTFVKALAYFRGSDTVSFDDVRNVLPFILHDKLVQNAESPFFEIPENAVYRVDRISWLRNLFDLSCAEYDRLGLDARDPVRDLLERFEKGLEGVAEAEAKAQIAEIETTMKTIAAGRKLHGPTLDDVLTLKYLHQRYTNYLAWLKWSK